MSTILKTDSTLVGRFLSMRIHALIVSLLVLAGWTRQAMPAGYSEGQGNPELHFKKLGEPLPEGTQVGVVQRRAGLETKFEVVKFQDGGFTVKVPPRDGKGETVTWFLVVGMTQAEQFDGFLDHPEKWSWFSFVTRVGQGQRRSMLFENTTGPLDFFGRVVGPGGTPLERLSVRFWGQSQRFPGKEREDVMRVGYDPCSGRFWAQRLFAKRPALTDYRLDFLPHPEHEAPDRRLARLFRVPCTKGKRLRIRIPSAASIRGKILGLENGRVIRYQLKLTLENGIDAGPLGPQHDGFVFQGLPEGRYRLRLQVGSDLNVLYSSKVLALGAGQKMEVPDIDLRKQLRNIQVRVRDASGHPIVASIHHVYRSIKTASHMASMSGKSTRESGAMTLLIPKTGVPLVIRAEGWGPAVFQNVTEDLDVVLKRPTRVTLKIQGPEKDSKLMNSLFLLAQPVDGYPDWAWRAMAKKFGWEESRRPERKHPVAMASARLDRYGNRRMDIPYPGKWKFELAYCRRFKWVRIPFPAMGILQIESEQELDIQLPLEALRKARARFEAIAKPR